MRVITYQAPDGSTIDITRKQVTRMQQVGFWPRSPRTGEEYCTVSHGLHEGEPTLHEYYSYSDDGQETVFARSLDEAVQLIKVPGPEQIADGGWLVIRGKDTPEYCEYGRKPQA